MSINSNSSIVGSVSTLFSQSESLSTSINALLVFTRINVNGNASEEESSSLFQIS